METDDGVIRRASMKNSSFKFNLLDFFTQPQLPPRALSIGRKEIAVADVRWKKGNLVVNRAAVGVVPDGAIEPSFDGINVKNKAELTKALGKVIEAAGLARQKKWSVVIPQAVCRTFILDLDQAPARKKELAQVIEWKVERFVGVAASELTVAVQALSSAGTTRRFLVVVALNEAVAAYESACSGLGLQVGHLVPTNVAEAGWLLMKAGEGDAMLVSLEGDLLSMVFSRDREVLATRAVTCSPESVADEIHRTLVYYQDKLSGDAVQPQPSGEGVETGADQAAPSNGGHELSLIVLINHNETPPTRDTKREGREVSGASTSPITNSAPADTPMSQRVGDICRDLFLPHKLPTLYSLHEQKLEHDPSLTLSRLAAAVGIASASKR
jgi:hypothetical protein